jgi:hypothetical protein
LFCCFFFFLVVWQRRKQLCIEEEEDYNYRHLLQWLCCKEMVTSAFLLWFCCEEGDGSNVVTFLYGGSIFIFLCWCLWFTSLELIFNNKWWFFV